MTWPLQAGESWKLSLPCTKAEAEKLAADPDPLPGLDPPPVLMTSEPDPGRPELWQLDVYFEGKPGPELLDRVRALAPSAAGADGTLERLADEDWVVASQRGMEPVRAGRFFVHTPEHRGEGPADSISLEIGAGRAFGTGHHETTTGCLGALHRLQDQGATFGNIVDVGTGTGLLAFAALKLWPEALVAASDIDPISIEVTEENAAVNSVSVGEGAGQVELVIAPGLEHPRLTARAPYDLVIANILAGPLIDLAPSIAAALEDGGSLILAGLLETQAAKVAAAYEQQGLRESFRIVRGDWPTLVMEK
ncbi:MAG TPA: 50S ribosomal protein L11 methyltransferase [Allosphingosinicella sp.]|nr:50S ribosomal protein L11 methyltransferase [Allosphingosinicella sp.]